MNNRTYEFNYDGTVTSAGTVTNTKTYEFDYEETVTSAGTVAGRIVSYDIVFSDPVPTDNASLITSGTLPDARLSSNVPLKNTVNIFTQNQTINGDVEITDSTKGIILKSGNNTRWRITITDNGTLQRVALSILAALAIVSSSMAQTVTDVVVGTNGTLAAPTNFFTANLPNWATTTNPASAASSLGQTLSAPSYLRTSSRDTSSNNAGGIVSAISFDGINWEATRNHTIFPVFSRDASPIWYSNKWVSIYTDAFGSTNKTFGIATSTDLLSWQTNFSVTLTGTNTAGTGNNVWAPEWFVDGTNYYALVRLSTTAGNNYGAPGVGWMRALNPGTWTSWSDWTPFDSTVRIDANDFYIVKKDNLYWLFSHGGTHLNGKQPAGSNVINNITLQYSTNPFGNYSPLVEITEPLRQIIRPGNSSAFFEGPSVVNVEGSRWRLFFQDGLDNTAWAIDSYDDFATWNTNSLRRLQYSGFDGSGHGTVVGINTSNQQGVRQAVLALGTGPTIGGAWLTNTNVTNFRTAIGALATNGSAAGLTNFPTLNQNTTGTASNVTGVVALANGGTGATNATNARSNLGLGTAATNASTDFQPASANLTNLASNNAINLTNFPALLLRTNGSAAGLTSFPTLNQNTTGTASNVTGVVAITNGGTGTNSAGGARTNLELGVTNSVVFSNITANGTLGVSNAATFATNVTIVGNLTAKSLVTSDPVNIILDATQTSAATNGVLTLPDNANLIRLTNNNAISAVTNGRLGSFYYLVNQATNAVTLSNVGGITVDGATNLTLSPNESATLVALGPTNISVANRGGLETNNNVTFSNITASGASFATNVGIGITNPLTALHISRDAADFTAGNAQLTVGGSTTINKKLIIGYNTTGNYSFLESAEFGVAVTPLNLNPSGGNVGIGTTNPTQKLTVNGTLLASGNATLNGTDNLAPSQTTNSASSLMTRSLSDARYGEWISRTEMGPLEFSTATVTAVSVGGSYSAGSTNILYGPTMRMNGFTNTGDYSVVNINSASLMFLNSAGVAQQGQGIGLYVRASVNIGTNRVARISYGGVSSNQVAGLVGTNGLDRRGFALEIMPTTNSSIHNLRLIAQDGTNGIVASALTPVTAPVVNASYFVAHSNNASRVYYATEFNRPSRTPVITLNHVFGAGTGPAQPTGILFSVVNTNNDTAAGIFIIRGAWQMINADLIGY